MLLFLIFKANIAKLLLEATNRLHNSRQNISIYLFDLGYDNISFNRTAQRVYFIDLENLLVVDDMKNKFNADEDFYEKKFEDCGKYGDCLSYDANRLCRASKGSDLNFYSGFKRRKHIIFFIRKNQL